VSSAQSAKKATAVAARVLGEPHVLRGESEGRDREERGASVEETSSESVREREPGDPEHDGGEAYGRGGFSERRRGNPCEHGVERMVVVARKGRQYAPERSADEVLEHEDLVEPQRCVERDETQQRRRREQREQREPAVGDALAERRSHGFWRRATSRTTSSTIASRPMRGANPMRSRALSMQGTRRRMSSKPSRKASS